MSDKNTTVGIKDTDELIDVQSVPEFKSNVDKKDILIADYENVSITSAHKIGRLRNIPTPVVSALIPMLAMTAMPIHETAVTKDRSMIPAVNRESDVFDPQIDRIVFGPKKKGVNASKRKKTKNKKRT